MPFGYVVVQYINQKSYYWDLLVHLLIWPQEGPKDEYFGPKWQTRLYYLVVSNKSTDLWDRLSVDCGVECVWELR